jgi:hypothetical protein
MRQSGHPASEEKVITDQHQAGDKSKDIVGYGGVEERYDYYLRPEEGGHRASAGCSASRTCQFALGGQIHAELCRIAFKGNKYPYMAPFQYVFMDGSIYFHFTDYGRKMRLLEKDKRVCVEIEKYKPDLSEYKFIVLRAF